MCLVLNTLEDEIGKYKRKENTVTNFSEFLFYEYYIAKNHANILRTQKYICCHKIYIVSGLYIEIPLKTSLLLNTIILSDLQIIL